MSEPKGRRGAWTDEGGAPATSEEGRRRGKAPRRLKADAVPFRRGVLELDQDGKGRLIGSRCPSCGAHFFPAREVCSGCLTEDLKHVPLSGQGTLYTYTVVRQSTPGFTVPYLLGYVDLPEGVRVLGVLHGLAEGQARIGMDLTLVTVPAGTDDEGRQVIRYGFQPAAEGSRDE